MINDIPVSENFNLKEFHCRHCHKVKLHQKLLELLQTLRNQVGRPIVILSGYRCPVHNKNEGGKPNSYHLGGMAADIRIPAFDMDIQRRHIERVFGPYGIGRYGTYTHVDIGPQRRW